MKRIAPFALLALAGCASTGMHKVELHQVQPMQTEVCEKVSVSPCGLSLVGCGDAKLEYDCLSDVKYVGPVAPMVKQEKK